MVAMVTVTEPEAEGGSPKPLMKPIQIGLHQLKHRVVLAPMTRCRARNTLATDMMKDFYCQRATEGGLLISEGVCVAANGHGFVNTAGIYTSEQVSSWKPITKAVHSKGATFFLQLWHVGRASHTDLQPGNAAPISSTPSPIPMPWRVTLINEADGETFKEMYSTPRALHANEIPDVIEYFRAGARNALEAGFDGCEIHGAHGYLLDSFVKDSINDRTDAYGGSMANRCRLLLEVAQAVVAEIGAHRTGIRISPFSVYNAASADSDPEALLVYLLGELDKLGLAYIHLTEPEFTYIIDDFTWAPQFAHVTKRRTTPLLVSGGHSWDSGNEAVRSGYADLVAFGRSFIANPDLVTRFVKGAPLNAPVPTTFYGDYTRRGYTDYPFLDARM
uniref:12-oxo-phytodienoate reductase n=1 Tax=Pohlia nutans TaxID=140635 RepID=A0A4D6QFV4_9BRYO|nr:12-oxo-phytodienoate reductase [Pohlia nutans]